MVHICRRVARVARFSRSFVDSRWQQFVAKYNITVRSINDFKHPELAGLIPAGKTRVPAPAAVAEPYVEGADTSG